MAIATQQSGSLRALVRTVTQELSTDSLPVLDMSRATALELDPTISNGQHAPGGPVSEIQRLEGPILAREVPRHIGSSPIRYFLDGSQKTLPVWRVGATPVITSVIAVGILERNGPSEIRIVPGTLVARLHWILPRYTGNPTLNRMVELLESMGERVIDPLEAKHRDDPESYQQHVRGYTHVLEQAYSTASNLRAQAELDMLSHWQREISSNDRRGWIVVDGRLTTDTPNAVGLVKDVQAQHLDGAEATILYDLPAGQRTSAFTLLDAENREQTDRTMWYLRMQNATGRDARHGLIRLETPAILSDPDLIDLISSWILAERAPKPSTDPRWPTLLYPIHLLERILKSRIGALTTGWPT